MDGEKLLKIKNNIKTQYNQQKNLTFIDFINSKSFEIIKDSELFDEEFYFSNYPDVKLSGIDPITHYLSLGVYEDCNPNNWFITKDYLEKYGDVKESGINPFVHYILYGFAENRIMVDINDYLEQKYLVSIIMPTFNRRNFISSAINSVLNQSFKNFELIIVDDGSNDNTDEFINEHYKKFISSGKVKYFKLDHGGVCPARNFGLKQSKGDIIAYLDSDNQWDLKFLEIMVKALDQHEEYNCAYCSVKVNHLNNQTYVLNSKFDRKSLLIENFIDINSFIHLRELYDLKGGFDENLTRLVDWDLIIRYTERNNPLFVDKILVNYFIDESLKNITLVEPLGNNMDTIHKKYWKELYKDEYETIVDYFDQDYYLTEYYDILKSNIPPIYHFLSRGYKENRNPNAEFVTSYYVEKYPEVLEKGLNPFVHYVKWGELEGREINYFKKIDEIISNNSIYLSNYSFDKEPLVSIIILNRNGLSHLKVLFKDFSEKTNYSNFEIIVVDNDSSDNSVNYLKSLRNLPITIIENKENVSFSKGNNDAVKIANGDYILLLNNDIEPTYGWLNEMMGTILYNDNVGAVGAKLLYPYIVDKTKRKYSFTIQHAGDIFREKIKPDCNYSAHNQGKFREDIFDKSLVGNKKCLLVTGAVLLVKKDIYFEVGGLDEIFWYGYEDVDFNLKLNENGYDVILANSALLFHHESATPRDSDVLPYNAKTLCKKWSGYLFKKLLSDKLEKKYFFTDKKFSVQLVANHNFHSNEYLTECITDVNDFFIKNDYNSSVVTDISNLQISGDVDVLISFTKDYDVLNILARDNIIKILIIRSDDFVEDHDYNGWDIIVATDEKLKNFFKEKNVSSVYLESNPIILGDKIISSIYDTFLEN